MRSVIFRQRKFFGLTVRRIVIFLALSLITAVFESFGVAAILPVLEFAENGKTIEQLSKDSELWRLVILFHDFFGQDVSLVTLMAGALFLMLARVGMTFFRQIFSSWLTQDIQDSVRSKLFSAKLSRDFAQVADDSSGEAINILTIETQRASSSFIAIFSMVSNSMVLVGLVFLLCLLSTTLTLIALGTVTLSAGFAAYFVKRTRKQSYVATKSNSRFSKAALERLRGIRLIKLSGVVGRESEFIRLLSGDIKRVMFYLNKANAKIDLVIEPMVLITGCLIFYFAFSHLEMRLSELSLFMLILIRLLPLVKEITRSGQTYNSCIGSLEKVTAAYTDANENGERQFGARRFGGLKNSIRLVDVDFKYPGSSRMVLSRFNADFIAGEMTAVVGPSGVGKTTLVDLISGLHFPNSGKIFFDESVSSEFDLHSLRGGMALVSQDPVFFDGSVAYNLRFSAPNATESDMWDALNSARAAEFVKSLSGGLHAEIGEFGDKLSGGQRQRLALARALLKDEALLILDEPTSALDAETEDAIHLALKETKSISNKTIIVIAHRLSTIRAADRIIAIVNGSEAKTGVHDELMASDEWYRRMIQIQLRE